MKSSIQLSPNKHLENISKMFRKLYNDEQLADVTLCCKDGTIKAHKLILATSSPYFHRIFTENNREHPILIMHGVAYQHLNALVELIYKGNVDVLPELLNPLYDLASEFQLSGITGVLREEFDKSLDAGKNETVLHGRDTRYKGLKRVAVDYKDTENKTETSSPPKRLEKESPKSPESPTPADKNETYVNGAVSDDVPTDGEEVADSPSVPPSQEPPKLSAWALKLRKFQCDLCPSSFKRSSHLRRHQLVHTGERPFPCDQCDKAFSRHDKLKHHVRKTHEQDYEGDYSMEMSHSMVASPPTPPLPFVISHVRTEIDDDEDTSPPAPSPANSGAKRPRGRPRKYPIVPKPLPKRGRGRPRLNPVRPRDNGQNYDITNLPYGDLDYLTMSMIEPYVEIKTDNNEEGEKSAVEAPKVEVKPKDDVKEREEDENTTALQVLESRIAKIGECTISVANH